jgi:adenylate kinase
MSLPPKLIIMGAPASGKGTQCEFIRGHFGVVHLSTGDILRKAATDGTQVGLTAKEFMNRGELVPDDMIVTIVLERLMEVDCTTRGWLLDGFPRTAEQGRALLDKGIVADIVIQLDVPDSILVERVVGRRTDPETGNIYHLTFKPPPNSQVSKRLIQRSDDTEAKVKVRINAFHKNMGAITDLFKDRVIKVKGDRSAQAIWEELKPAISTRLTAVPAPVRCGCWGGFAQTTRNPMNSKL